MSEPVEIHVCELFLPSDWAGFQVKCSVCGTVGGIQEFEGDAQAIADRHNEIQGFERAAARRSAR